MLVLQAKWKFHNKKRNKITQNKKTKFFKISQKEIREQNKTTQINYKIKFCKISQKEKETKQSYAEKLNNFFHKIHSFLRHFTLQNNGLTINGKPTLCKISTYQYHLRICRWEPQNINIWERCTKDAVPKMLYQRVCTMPKRLYHQKGCTIRVCKLKRLLLQETLYHIP